MDTLSLQSWLVQSERRIHLKCPKGLFIKQDEYLSTLQETAKELQLPLQLETVSVNWGDANLQQTRIRAKLQSKERFGILTGLDYIGRVAFVEQKTYLESLDVPHVEKPNTSKAMIIGGGIAFFGVILSIIGIAGSFYRADLFVVMLCVTCLGMLGIFIGIGAGFITYTRARAEPDKKLARAIKKWADDIVNLARRAEVSNELNNTAQALDEAVKLAVDRLFIQKGAEMEADERKRKTAVEILNEVNLRKEEFN
jgi:hypothetical protein